MYAGRCVEVIDVLVIDAFPRLNWINLDRNVCQQLDNNIYYWSKNQLGKIARSA